MSTRSHKKKATAPEANPTPAPDPLDESRGVLDRYNEDGQATVNGKPVSLDDPHVFFQHTDQYIAMENIKKNRTGSGVEVKSDLDMTIERGQHLSDSELWEDIDPMAAAVRAHIKPGFAGRFLSERICQQRGLRKWEPVIADGKNVKVGPMMLATMPMSKVQQRNAHYRELGNAAIRDAEQAAVEKQARLIRDSRVSGLAPLNRGETVRGANGEGSAIAGLHAQRGNSGAAVHFTE
jgi:hypothetical protein